jgi:energy-coupling factor transporter ATP-binding protein EcfA2
MDYFKDLTHLLKTEQEEDKQAYRELTERSSVAERRAAGLCWYPIIIRDTEPGRGDYLTVEIERTNHQDVLHQFRFGASAALFSQHDPGNDRIEGTISFQGGDRIRISLRVDELPDWTRDGKLGIDLLFDDNSYTEMFNALRLAPAVDEKTDKGRLIRILTGEKPPTFQEIDQHALSKTELGPPRPPLAGTELDPSRNSLPKTGLNPSQPHLPKTGLNLSQQAAVKKILAANELAIVHGPPGTGKTTTLVQAIKALIEKEGGPILVTAPSNTAVDLLSEKLSGEGLNVLRIGNPARVSESLTSITLDSRMAEHPMTKEIKKLRKQASAFRDMAHKYKRNFGQAEREQRKALFNEARNIMKEVERMEQYILDDLLGKAQVITATLVGAAHYTIRDLSFHTAVIDEAGQALEPACWIPVLKAQKLVLAGDHCQLPPTVKSAEAAHKGLSTTLLEKCVARYPQAVVLLEEQYRMHEMIMGYPAAVFYEQRLKAHSSVANSKLFPADRPFVFVDTAGCGFDEKTEGISTSNPEEAAFLFKHLAQFTAELQTQDPSGDLPRVAVISPYRQQIELLKEQLQCSPLLKIYGNRINVNTIDSFQGQERDIVYISMTRSNPDSRIGFLSDIRRMNVAMTRARKKLVVIGDSATLAQSPFYAGLIRYAEEQGAWQSAWELADG